MVVIDDDRAHCELLQDVLQPEGYPTECYLDGLSGLARVAAGGIGLVLLDWMLPEVGGSAVLGRVATGPALVPVAVITAAGPTMLREPPPGAVALLSKPFDLDELLALVHRYCRPPASLPPSISSSAPIT